MEITLLTFSCLWRMLWFTPVLVMITGHLPALLSPLLLATLTCPLTTTLLLPVISGLTMTRCIMVTTALLLPTTTPWWTVSAGVKLSLASPPGAWTPPWPACLSTWAWTWPCTESRAMSTQTSGTHQVELRGWNFSTINKTHFVCSPLPIFISFIFSNNPNLLSPK